MEVLHKEAEREGINANALLNRILKDFSEFHRFSQRFGIVSLSVPTLSILINCCSKEIIKDTADFSVHTVVEDGIRTIGFKPNYNTILFFIKNIFGGLAGWFECNHHIMNDKETFHLRHSLGNNWSIFIASVISKMFDNFLNEKVETEISKASVTITRKRK